METTNQKIQNTENQNTVENFNYQYLLSIRPETQEAILQQVGDKINNLMQGEMDEANSLGELIYEARNEYDDAEEEKQEAEEKIEELKEQKEAKQQRADIMASIMDRMDECRDAAENAQAEGYDLEDDEEGIGDLLDELIDKIQEVYDTAQGAAEDHSDEIDDLESKIEDLEEDVNDAETRMDKWADKQEQAEERQKQHKTMVRLYEKILARVLYKDWTALLNWMETAEAEVVSTNQENPEQINSVLHELYDSINEAIADNPDETPAEAEARMAEEDKEQQEATEQAADAATKAAAEDEYIDRFHDLTHWVLTDWDGSITASITLASKKTEVNLWKTAAYESMEEAKKQANDYLNLTTYSGEQAGAAKFLQEVEG